MLKNKVHESARWRHLPDNHPLRAIGMTALVAIAAALLVSISVVQLRPAQLARQQESQKQMLSGIVGKLPGLEDTLVQSGVDSLLTRWVNLDTDEVGISPPSPDYDSAVAASDPAFSVEIPSTEDVAGIGRRARIIPVHLLEKQNQLELVVLPIYGTGYQSTIRAWLALSGDLSKVIAFSIVDQAETPGLGARIVEPQWLAQWAGRPVYGDNDELKLRVSKGTAISTHEIDGISGATRTGNGINNMLEYWLGDSGFGPFLDKIRQENRNS